MSLLFITLQQADGAAGGSIVSTLFSLLIAVVVIAGMWKVFTKAGQPGWASIIPIYNTYVLLNRWQAGLVAAAAVYSGRQCRYSDSGNDRAGA